MQEPKGHICYFMIMKAEILEGENDKLECNDDKLTSDDDKLPSDDDKLTAISSDPSESPPTKKKHTR